MAQSLPSIAGKGRRRRQDRDMKNVELSDDMKEFIVICLAQFVTPNDVIPLVKEKFGVTLDKQRIEYYDPTRSVDHPPAERWVTLFDMVRTKHVHDLSRLRLANRVERIKELSNLFDKAKTEIEGAQDAETKLTWTKEARTTLEQIADEASLTVPMIGGASAGGSAGDIPSFIAGAMKYAEEQGAKSERQRLGSGQAGDGTTADEEVIDHPEFVEEAKDKASPAGGGVS